ncbi:MAG: AraC family transcriptional regulator [Leptospiraceae bacterium]|nr:AraC family transcriptional regulator [Leptospiraceae bacterium]
MDILSEIIDNSNWKADLLIRSSFPKNCGFIFPCQHSAGFHIALNGSLFLKHKRKMLELRKGDLVFISRGVEHELLTSPSSKAIPISEFKTKFESKSNHKSDATSFISIRYATPNYLHPFFHELPPIFQIKSESLNFHDPLIVSIQLISMELEKGIGSDILIQRFADIILYYSLRHILEKKLVKGNWLRVMNDEKLLVALEALHSNFQNDWSLRTLSGKVGISTVTLTKKFKQFLKTTPMDYLASLRIEKGRNLLKNEKLNLEEVAKNVGYSNGFAFSKAYKRINGVSPSLDQREYLN